MNLFEDIEAENYKFINVIEALELVAKKIIYGVSDIARRLLIDEFNKIACMFKINDYGKIESYCSEKYFNGGYTSTTEFLKLAISTSGTFDYTETDTFGNEYEYTKEFWDDYYWLKSDFFNSLLAKKVGISEEYYENTLKADREGNSHDFIAQLAKRKQDEIAKEDAKTNSDTPGTVTAQQKSKEICNAQSHIDLESLIKLNDDYISVFEVFEIIKNKTVLKLDRKIADLFIGFNFTKKSKPYNKASYFNGQPVELFRDYQDKTLTEMDLLLIELGSGEICIESNDQRLHNFVWDKFDFFFEFKSITKIDLENEDEDVTQNEVEKENSEQTLNQDENNREQLLYLNDTLTIDEAACIISGDNPSDIKYALDNEKILSYKNFLNAQRLVQSAIQLGNLSIYRDFGIATFEFKAFLIMKNLIIKGFNDNQIDKDDSMGLLAEQMTGQSIYISQLENRIEVYESSPQVNHEQLKLELAQAKELIKQLETKQKDEKLETQTNQDESKLGTREENNIIKVLAVLADMEKKIDTSKPYEAHGIMFNKAQLLGIDKFPSNESIKKWFIKANEYKKT